MIKAIFDRFIFEPLYEAFYKRDSKNKWYSYHKKQQWDTLEKNEGIQKDRLFRLLDYSIKEIPYYRDLAKEHNIIISKDSVFEDIKKFPILTKDIIAEKFELMHPAKLDKSWQYNHSGGSTGQPVKLIQDKYYHGEASAITKIQYEWAGFYPGDTMIKLWGSQRDILNEKEKLQNRFSNWMRSVYVLNSFAMDKDLMNEYIKIINKKKPKMILAYVQSINELSLFILHNNIKVYSPKSIMTSAGILYPEFRDNIEKAFNCKVFNRYGSREIGNVASECERHEGLHVSLLTHYLEILDKKLKPCKESQSGDIYTTLLINYSMPLIRYKIGDMASYTNKQCSCKRGLPLLKEVIGRDSDVFKTKDGKIIEGLFFVHFIGVVFNQGYISKFQVIQKDYEHIVIKYVPIKQEEFNKSKDKIISSIKKVMGEKCRIDFEKVDDIEPTKSGKYRYTIREFE